MTRPFHVAIASLMLSMPALAQACDAPVDTKTGTVEVVTFRLADGNDAAAFREAAAGTMPFLCATDGFLRRTLSVDADGLWTDHVEWADEASATAAAEAAMAEPGMAPFMTAIDPDTMSFRYATPVALE